MSCSHDEDYNEKEFKEFIKKEIIISAWQKRQKSAALPWDQFQGGYADEKMPSSTEKKTNEIKLEKEIYFPILLSTPIMHSGRHPPKQVPATWIILSYFQLLFAGMALRVIPA